MQAEVSYGNTTIPFSIQRSSRKSLAIEVHPDLSVRVIAPMEAALQAIREKVLKRAAWIVKQQQFFEQFLPRTPERPMYPENPIFIWEGSTCCDLGIPIKIW